MENSAEFQEDIADFLPEVVLYHKSCFDGTAAAWAFKEFIKTISPSQIKKEIEYIPVSHSANVPEETKGKRVLILDYCFKQDKLDALIEQASYVLILDHHKTTESIVVTSTKCKLILDMKRSGAEMAWDYFHRGIPRPWVINYIGDRDLWLFRLPNSKIINTYIYSLPVTFETLDSLQFNHTIEECFEKGKLLNDAYMENVKKIINDEWKAIFTSPVSQKEYIVGVTPCPWFYRSDVGNTMCSDRKEGDDIDFAVLYTYYANSKQFSVSLRGHNKVDCSAIAQEFNGGGHPNASAFKHENLDFLKDLPKEDNSDDEITDYVSQE